MKFLSLLAVKLLSETMAQIICSCSPTQYNFRLDLSADCDASTITEEQDGIDGSLCFFGEGSSTTFTSPEESTSSLQVLTSPIIEVTSALFLEIDTTPEMNIIKQDSTYFTTNLPGGSVVTFSSISNQLDYMLSIEDQMEYVPGGVVIVLFGNDRDGNVVQNTVAWDYDHDCENEPLSDGNTIGWVKIVSHA